MTSEHANEPRNILLPIDGSEHSKRAVNFYLKELLHSNDKVYFLHISETSHSKSINNLNNSENLDELIDTDVHHAIKQSVFGIEFISQSGPKPGVIICQVAQDKFINVILIGNRGLGLMRRTILGSVSDYVLHHSNTPIILIPPTK